MAQFIVRASARRGSVHETTAKNAARSGEEPKTLLYTGGFARIRVNEGTRLSSGESVGGRCHSSEVIPP
jgi:hypothetical protein